MKTFLITGASGFIGKKLVENYLNKDDVEIYGVGTGESPFCGVEQDNLKWIRADLTRDLTGLFSSLDVIDVVYHCAGSASVGYSIDNPIADFEKNTYMLQNLLWALQKSRFSGVFIFLSSASVYGNQNSVSLDESMMPKPISPYALNKSLCESICSYFVGVKGFDIRIARIFSAYGKGLKKQLLWDVVKRIQNCNELALFGTGNEGRDFIHVVDVVRALELILNKGSVGVYNIGNGKAIKISEIAEIFNSNLTGDKAIIFNGSVKDGDPQILVANSKKLLDLGYNQSVSIENGVREYIQWAEGQI